jgi:UDP-N-acetylglucosamine 2-epimerase (non-hydrolysing)
MRKILFIFGTRPEAIKMVPLIKEAKNHPEFDVKVCVTGQHREMLDQVLNFFGVVPDSDLNIMKPNQTLFDITADGLRALEGVLKEYPADFIFVQGDTTTAFIGALAGFYCKIKVVHIEAGLRSGQKYSPYPEEINRIMVSHLADYHFAPTEKAVLALEKESIVENVFMVGNTVVDALLLGLEMIKKQGDSEYEKFFSEVDFSKRIILVTGHRRESHGKNFEDMCKAMRDIADKFTDIEIVYPVHLSPSVRKLVYDILSNHPRIHLIEPLEYSKLLWLMNRSYLVLTDSGGMQEEAPSLGKPVLVMRDVTERTEGIDAGTAILVGTNRQTIFTKTENLLTDTGLYENMAKATNPYGDGMASERIFNYLKKNE